VTLILAIWGAVVSTVAVCWNIVRDVLKRPKVVIHAMIARSPGTVALPRPLTLAVEITNVGQEPVVIKGLASDKGKKSTVVGVLLTPTVLPRRLEPKDSVVEPLRDFGFIKPGTKRFYVWDSTGKHWYLPSKTLQSLVKEAQKQNLT
jgi:hypothetical protein